MDDDRHPPDDDPQPHLNLERRLTVGPHIYQLTASGRGDARIGLTVVGWNASGEVVSEISGGISPADLAPVAEALTSTLAGLATLRRQDLTSASPPTAPAPAGRRHPQQGVRWSAEDDERLAARHRAGAGLKDLMEEFGRSRGGIVARLERLGLVTPPGVPAALTRFDAPEPGSMAAAQAGAAQAGAAGAGAAGAGAAQAGAAQAGAAQAGAAGAGAAQAGAAEAGLAQAARAGGEAEVVTEAA
jgi:hypothetical protein